ncbi:MAG TPA: Smr/MutS family protein [Acidisarcina sp.]
MAFLTNMPSPMEDFSSAALEWGRMLELLAGYSQSGLGREWALGLAPSADAARLEREHGLVAEMRLLLRQGVSPALGSLFDPTVPLDKSRIDGAALEAEEIRDLLGLLDDVNSWQALILSPPAAVLAQLPELEAMAAPLAGSELPALVKGLRTKVMPDGSLADDASPDLRRIRREIERQQRHIEESLRGMLRRLAEGGATQDELITIRGERFVIPIKAEQKRRVQGVVHGTSSSGQTVYVEPLETIEQNNELVRLFEEEQSEIHRIFLAITRQIGAQAGTILAGARILAEVESLMIRGRFAEEYQCVRPRFRVEGEPELTLVGARHPLLEKRLRGSGGVVVPLTIRLTASERQLIISGPNTGGKTVGLKTTGLLAVLAQSGVPVPAEEAVLPVFTSVLADIGDAQSIEQNLSTFSAHMVNLDRISHVAGRESLVLLDELGSATDPEEGAALAVAIAEHFLRARAWCLISTHHTALKVYGVNTPGVLNAAVGFDERTLAPTYALRLGVPGASAGINIASRLGLNAEIIAAARSKLHSQTLDIARFLEELHGQLEAVGAERAALQRQEQEVAREKNRLDVEGLKEWRAKVRELETKLQSLLKDFEYQMRETVRVIDDRAAQQKLSKEAERRIARLRREFSEQFNSSVVADHTGADRGDAHAQPHLVSHIAAGDSVRLKSLGKTAVVQRQVDQNTFEVAVGAMKMRVPRADIAEVAPAPVAVSALESARRRGVTVRVAEPDADMSWELNVIGRTVDEATDEVSKFLDRAFLAGLPRVRVIHGVGMGVLRRGLRGYLAGHPQVASVVEAGQGEGGAGATLVELKQ